MMTTTILTTRARKMASEAIHRVEDKINRCWESEIRYEQDQYARRLFNRIFNRRLTYLEARRRVADNPYTPGDYYSETKEAAEDVLTMCDIPGVNEITLDVCTLKILLP